MKSNGIFQFAAETSSNNHSITENQSSKSSASTDLVDNTTDYITGKETCTYTMETSKFDFAALETQKSEVWTNVEQLSGAIGVQTYKVASPHLAFDRIADLVQEVSNTPSHQVFHPCSKESSHTKLENECDETTEIKEGELVSPLIDYSNRPSTTKPLVDSEDDSRQLQDLETCENSSSKMVQSIFVEMFKEMQDIEDYINSYISSFCPLEEEFENHPVLDVPSERALHFLEQVHSPTKVTTSHDKNNVLHSKDYPDKNSELCRLEIKQHAKLHEHLEPVSSEMSECSCIFAKDGMKNEMEQLETVTSNEISNKINETGCVLYPESCSTPYEFDDKQNGYCYWEDIETYDLKGESEVLVSEIQLPIGNTSLINVEFFENIWKEITDSIDKDIAYRHEERLTSLLPRDKMFIQEIQSTEPLDRILMEEAENIKHTIDNFITNECFPCQNNDNYPDCSILEINNENFDSVFLRESPNSSQSLKSLPNEEVLRESQAECKVSETEFQVFRYFQHLSENTSNLSLFPEDELKDGENISLSDLRKRNTGITGNISEDNLTDNEEYYFNASNISSISIIEIVDTETKKKVPQTNVSVPGFSGDAKSSVEPIPLLNEIKIELAPSFSDLTFDVVSVGGVKIKQEIPSDLNLEICDSIKDSTLSPSNHDPDIVIKLENVVDEIDEVTNNTNTLKQQKINEDSLFEDEISKSVLVNNSNETVFTDFCLVKENEVLSTNKAPENESSKSESQDNSVDRSIFVQLPDDGTCQTNSQFIFSSNKVQLNLTNPVLNVNKK
ncbi:hypothetical protein J6590_020495 [Homalodisca vitripennis]|nr:hypothetical protein J6590_020495 [Homalodisca vitripennis]